MQRARRKGIANIQKLKKISIVGTITSRSPLNALMLIACAPSNIKNKATIFSNEADNSTRYGSELNNRATVELYTMSDTAKKPVIKNEIICALQVIG